MPAHQSGQPYLSQPENRIQNERLYNLRPAPAGRLKHTLMRHQRTYTVCQLANYLQGLRYQLTYRQGTRDAYYNPRNRQIMLLPSVRETILTTAEIIRLFRQSHAVDMPPELEFIRFSQFIDLMYND